MFGQERATLVSTPVETLLPAVHVNVGVALGEVEIGGVGVAVEMRTCAHL
jgi:hypothetical protein